VHEFQYWLKIVNFSYTLSFNAFDRGDPFRIYEKVKVKVKVKLKTNL